MRRFTIFTSIVVLLGLGAAAKRPLTVKGGDAVSVGVYVATVDSGRVVMEQDSRRLLTPASILKSLTVATAYGMLGPDYRWSTTVSACGPVADGGVLMGDLVIKGGGDPTLGSRHFKEQPSFIAAVTGALRKRGITRIAGNIVVDSSAVPDGGAVSSWEVEDIGWDYGAGAYALNWSDNTFTINVPAMTTSMPVPDLNVVNALTPRGSSLTLTRGVGSNTIVVGGSLRGRKQATLFCSMPDPGAVLVNRLEASLVASGIRVEHGAPAGADSKPVELLTYHSPKLAEVGRSLMVRSDNLMAEATLRAIAPEAPLDSALNREVKYWRSKGLDTGYWRINDGSGLSRYNAISAATLGSVLRHMALDSTLSADYIDSFARVGLDGTLTSFMAKNPRKNEFVLKSGSMGGVQCYAGYRLDPDTRAATHVIVVMVNNLIGSRAELRRAVEQMLLNIGG